MMDQRALKIIEELLKHISDSEGMDLKNLMSKPEEKPEMENVEDVVGKEGMEEPEEDEMKPKGIAVEKVSIMGKPKMNEEMLGEKKEESMDEPTDDELEELLAKLKR